MKISKEMMKSWAETYDDAKTKYYWLSDIITLKSSDNLHCEYCGEHTHEIDYDYLSGTEYLKQITKFRFCIRQRDNADKLSFIT